MRTAMLLKRLYYDQDDEYLSGKNVPVTQYEYDEHGAVVKVKNMDKDRNLINDPENGIAITEYVMMLQAIELIP